MVILAFKPKVPCEETTVDFGKLAKGVGLATEEF